MNGARILVLAPHPDDEAVGCAAAIGRARAAGARVFVLYLTDGVPEAAALWPWRRRGRAARVRRRWQEAEAAAATLGLAEAGRLDIPTRTLKAHLAEAEALISAALRETGAEVLWAPAWEGGHQDHDAANFLASRFAERLPVWEFAEYNFAGGRVRSHRFASETGGETVLTLTTAERRAKRAVLAGYASERGNLRHVGVAAEAFRPLPRHDYAAPPHPGRMFYQRFQWVPFHPRIDRCRPAAVSAALAAHDRRCG